MLPFCGVRGGVYVCDSDTFLREIALTGIIVVRVAPSGIVTLLESVRIQIATPADMSSVFAWLR